MHRARRKHPKKQDAIREGLEELGKNTTPYNARRPTEPKPSRSKGTIILESHGETKWAFPLHSSSLADRGVRVRIDVVLDPLTEILATLPRGAVVVKDKDRGIYVIAFLP